ncbi:hypothetical protein BKA56DRAFT_609776 [Ilyonectria sp. MPI-CAGE-AT-0026]|nr:hypothetical protein BKA56DRAFT_609776 [Ilyonectria sp. MPI-CAGE-AT-0026]
MCATVWMCAFGSQALIRSIAIASTIIRGQEARNSCQVANQVSVTPRQAGPYSRIISFQRECSIVIPTLDIHNLSISVSLPADWGPSIAPPNSRHEQLGRFDWAIADYLTANTNMTF